MDVRDGQVVKGVQFQQLRHAGDPAALARRYNVEGIDEVVVLDITATLESRQALARTINAVAHEIFLPLTVGGGIRDGARRRRRRRCRRRQGQPQHRGPAPPGSDLNPRAPLRQPGGDRRDRREAHGRGRKFGVFVRSGTADAARDAVEWAREAESRGAGEILLTSMDRDGTRAGFDCELTAAVADAVNIPGHRLGRRRRARALRRRLHGAAMPTRRSRHRSSTTPIPASPT